MMHLKFEHLFQNHILDRGTDLVDCVTHVNMGKNRISATVQGTHNYKIVINLNHDEIMDMSCTCPYADTGNACKHMAAVLFYVSEEDEAEEDTSYDNISKEELIEFLEEQFKQNKTLHQAFVLRFAPSDVDVKDLKRQFDQILRVHLGREGFINYARARHFFYDLNVFMETLWDMKEQGLYKACIEVVEYFTKDFDNIPLDDSDGGTGLLYDDLVQLLEALMDEIDYETEVYLLDWMNSVINNREAWFLKERLYPLWASQFNDEDLFEKKIEQIENRIYFSDAIDSYSFHKDIITYGELLLQRGDDFKDVLQILNPYKENPMVYKWIIEKCDERNLLELELYFIKEAMSFAEKNRYYGFIKDLNYIKLSYYEKTGDRETYLNIYRDIALSSYDVEDYLSYKKVYDGNWEPEKATLIEHYVKNRNLHILYDVYGNEKMHEALMNLIVTNREMNQAERYFEWLNPLFPKEMLQLYMNYLDREIELANSRKKYQQWIKLYKKFRKKFNTHPLFQEKLDFYKLKYVKRKAFVEELGKAGF